MKKILNFLFAVFISALQFVVFFSFLIIYETIIDCFSWKTFSVFNTLKFNVIAAYHTIRYNFKVLNK